MRSDNPGTVRSKYIFVSPLKPGEGREEEMGFFRRLVAADTYARFQRHRAADVWFPIGADGFSPGVASEAKRRGVSPKELIEACCERVRSVGRALGVELSGEFVRTSDPSYFRLTQWIFIQLQAKGLLRWTECRFDGCRACGERFRQGLFLSCPRCGADLERRELRERRVEIASYGDRLLGDLDAISRRDGVRAHSQRGDGHSAVRRSVWSDRDRKLQRELLGRVKGCEVIFPVSRPFELEYRELPVFTTQVELLYGVTFVLLEPYHPLLSFVLDPAYQDDVDRYRERLRKGGEPRISGVRTGGHALNPLSLERVPILVSALASRPGTGGALLGIPGHDPEHFELARRLQLPIREVVHSDTAKFDHRLRLAEPWLGDGVLTNSGPFCGLSRKAARERIIAALGRKGSCRKTARFRFTSLPVSGTGFPGVPVPAIRCPSCGEVPVPESELPLVERQIAPSGPSGQERSSQETPSVSCPHCGRKAVRDPERILPWLGEAWSVIGLALPHLAGPLEGFRDLSAQPPEEGPPEDLGAQRPREDEAQKRPQTAVLNVLPEDLDVFAPRPTSPLEEEPGREGDVAETLEQVPSETDREEGGGAGTAVLPTFEEPPRTEGALDASAESAGPPGEATPRGAQAEAPPEKPGAGDHTKAQRSQAPERAAAPEEGDEEQGLGPETFFQPSSLRPFRSPDLRRLPADFALISSKFPLRHLVALRFLTKFLHDMGHVPSHLPFLRCIRAAPLRGDGDSLEPLEHPEEFGRFGNDAVRLAILFAGPLDEPSSLKASAVRAMHRFLERIWRQMSLRRERGKFVSRRMLVEKHRLIYEVTRRISAGKFHTAVAALMAFLRFLEDPETAPEDMDRDAMSTFIVLLSPFAPRIAEELWKEMGKTESLREAPWPVASEELIHPSEREYLIYVDGKLCDRMVQPADLEPEKLESRALQRERVREIVGNRRIRRAVTVPGRLVSIALEKP